MKHSLYLIAVLLIGCSNPSSTPVALHPEVVVISDPGILAQLPTDQTFNAAFGFTSLSSHGGHVTPAYYASAMLTSNGSAQTDGDVNANELKLSPQENLYYAQHDTLDRNYPTVVDWHVKDSRGSWTESIPLVLPLTISNLHSGDTIDRRSDLTIRYDGTVGGKVLLENYTSSSHWKLFPDNGSITIPASELGSFIPTTDSNMVSLGLLRWSNISKEVGGERVAFYSMHRDLIYLYVK